MLLHQVILDVAARNSHREAVRDSVRSWTYGQLSDGVGYLAGALQELGVKAGDRCAVMLPNGGEFVRAHLGFLAAGAISVPIHVGMREPMMRSTLEDCAPRVVVTNTTGWARLTAAGIRPDIAVLDDGEQGGAQGAVLAMSDLVSAGREARGAGADQALPAAIMYTTGSTGRPKGVVLSHGNVLAAQRNIIGFLGYGPEDREVVTLPVSHSFGLGHVYSNLLSGGAVYLAQGLRHPVRVLDALETFAATGFPGTPMGFALLLDRYASILSEKGRNLRFSVINSAPLPPELTVRIRAALPELNVLVYYGLTEASRSTFLSLSSHGAETYRSVGPPMPGVEMRTSAPDGDEGEVLIRGPHVMSGYWNSAQETDAVLKDGWFSTGDIGQFDEDGKLFIVGRIKDLINVDGHKFSPVEVEEALRSCPGVADVAVAAVPCPVSGAERVVAGVVLERPGTFDPDAWTRLIAPLVEPYKLPSEYVEIEAVPRTDSGKTKRADLAGELSERLDARNARVSPC